LKRSGTSLLVVVDGAKTLSNIHVGKLCKVIQWGEEKCLLKQHNVKNAIPFNYETKYLRNL